MEGWASVRDAVASHPEVIGVAPYVEGEAWLRYDGGGEFVQIRGVDPRFETDVLQVQSPGFESLLATLDTTEDGIVLGYSLASRLGLYLGDRVSLMSLNSLVTRELDDVMSFRIIGAADFGFYGNDNTVMLSLGAASQLLGSANNAQDVQLRLRVSDEFRAGPIAEEALGLADSSANLRSTSWSETQSSLFDALRLEKTLTGFMLLMIVVIGAVNIVSTLVMVVADKSADIAILRTMGASKSGIMSIFVTQGTTVGILGTGLGAVLGVLITLNLTAVLRTLEGFLNAALPADNVYMISYMRAELQSTDVLWVCVCALSVSFLATLYPAYRATRILPAEVLRYE